MTIVETFPDAPPSQRARSARSVWDLVPVPADPPEELVEGATWIEEAPRRWAADRVVQPRSKRSGHAVAVVVIVFTTVALFAAVAFVGGPLRIAASAASPISSPTAAPTEPTGRSTSIASVERPLLSVGSTGDQVIALKLRLLALGFDPGPQDGQFGAATTSSVASFQRAAGIRADGVVGPKTWSALDQGRPVA